MPRYKVSDKRETRQNRFVERSLKERTLIMQHNGKRPYGAKLTFQILHPTHMGDLENVCILIGSGAVATIQPARTNSWEGKSKFQVSLDGFDSAAKAEAEGQRLAQALLIVAISLNFGLRLMYSGRLPAVVYQRFQSHGDSMWAEGVGGRQASTVLDELLSVYPLPPMDSRLILSMELYCAALLETNEHARFVSAVSALEPLVEQECLGGDVGSFVEAMLTNLENVGDIDDSLRDSFRGRIRQLRYEQFARHSFDCPVLGFLAALTCGVRSMTRTGYAANSYTEERFLILIPISR
jgi:hypothetical protein